jgi:hypothetical protein
MADSFFSLYFFFSSQKNTVADKLFGQQSPRKIYSSLSSSSRKGRSREEEDGIKRPTSPVLNALDQRHAGEEWKQHMIHDLEQATKGLLTGHKDEIDEKLIASRQVMYVKGHYYYIIVFCCLLSDSLLLYFETFSRIC